VFIAGGIAPRMVDILQNGEFRAAFERKSPHEDWARQVPACVIVHPEPALLGLSALVTRPDGFVVPFQTWRA
jgi:glucokinase